MNYYIEGEYSAGGEFFEGPFTSSTLGAALQRVEACEEINISNIIAEEDK